MATDVLTNFDSIEEKLLKAKSNLKGLNENIRRIIGREPPDNQLRLEIVFIFFFFADGHKNAIFFVVYFDEVLIIVFASFFLQRR